MATPDCPEELLPFARWLAKRFAARNADYAASERRGIPQRIAIAARSARTEARAALRGERVGRVEPLTVLAASQRADADLPLELRTPRGFRIVLSTEELLEGKRGSIAVLIEAPAEWQGRISGFYAYLWHGEQRFEIGQFDPDGRALGTLPVGLEISIEDLVRNRLQLEEPDLPEEG